MGFVYHANGKAARKRHKAAIDRLNARAARKGVYPEFPFIAPLTPARKPGAAVVEPLPSPYLTVSSRSGLRQKPVSALDPDLLLVAQSTPDELGLLEAVLTTHTRQDALAVSKLLKEIGR